MAADPAPGAEGEVTGLPQLDFSTWPEQIFWVLVAFAILYLFLSRSVLPSIGGAIEDRRDKIADDLDEAARLKREAEDAEHSYRKALAAARAKARALADDAREKVNAEVARESDSVEAALSTRLAEAEERIRANAETATANIDHIANDAVAEMVHKLTGHRPTADAVTRARAAATSS